MKFIGEGVFGDNINNLGNFKKKNENFFWLYDKIIYIKIQQKYFLFYKEKKCIFLFWKYIVFYFGKNYRSKLFIFGLICKYKNYIQCLFFFIEKRKILKQKLIKRRKRVYRFIN